MLKGLKITANGETGTITRTLHSANEGTPLVEYRRPDGTVRTARQDDVLYVTKSNPNGSLFPPSQGLD